MLQPSLDAIQTLLILGNTLQNIGQSDGAWVLLGTTIRLAQALGLHVENSGYQASESSAKAKELWYVHLIFAGAKSVRILSKRRLFNLFAISGPLWSGKTVS